MPKKPREKKPKTKNPKKNFGGRYRQKNALKNNITVVVDNSKKTSTRKPSQHNPAQTSSFPVQHIQSLPSPEIPNLLAYLKEKEKPMVAEKEQVEIKTEPISTPNPTPKPYPIPTQYSAFFSDPFSAKFTAPFNTPPKTQEKEDERASDESDDFGRPITTLRQVGRPKKDFTPETRARKDRQNALQKKRYHERKAFLSSLNI